MVAAPLSQSNCEECRKPTKGIPFCEVCHTLKELPETISDYEVLDVPRQLKLDSNLLQKQFYEKSKLLHPDQFATRPSEGFKALRWATRLNTSYMVLKDPIERSIHWLSDHGIAKEAQKAVPMELAEEYFEIQGEPSDSSAVRNFRAKIEGKLDSDLKRWDPIAVEVDQTKSSEKALLKLRDYLNEQRYLQSMLENLDRKVGD